MCSLPFLSPHITLLLTTPQAGEAITSLDVSDNDLSADTANLSAGLPQLSAVRALALNSCGLTTWPLSGLPPGCLQSLTSLELRGNVGLGVQPCPLDALAACPRLKSLDLSGGGAWALCVGTVYRGLVLSVCSSTVSLHQGLSMVRASVVPGQAQALTF